MLTKENQDLLDKVLKLNGTKEKALVYFCNNPNLEIVKELSLNPNYHAYVRTDSNRPLNLACWQGNIEIVKFLLTSKELKTRAKMTEDALMYAVRSKNTELVEYLLTEKSIKNKVSIYIKYESLLEIASHNNDVNMIKFLSHSNNIKINITDKSLIHDAFLSACSNVATDSVKYFLENKDYLSALDQKEKINFSLFLKMGLIDIGKAIWNNRELYKSKKSIITKGFENLVNAHTNERKQEQKELIEYFIFDVNIKKDVYVEQIIKNDDFIQKLFQKRDLNEKLNQNLNESFLNTTLQIKKIKI